jgi:flavin-binding protein dodecin
MDPVTLIVVALAAGATKGLTDAASNAVKDAYASLKKLVLGKVSDTPSGAVAVQEHEADPDTWQAPVTKLLTESGAGDDQSLVTAAQRLMELLDSAGAQAGKYVVNITASGDRSVAAHTVHSSVSTGDIHSTPASGG